MVQEVKNQLARAEAVARDVDHVVRPRHHVHVPVVVDTQPSFHLCLHALPVTDAAIVTDVEGSGALPTCLATFADR